MKKLFILSLISLALFACQQKSEINVKQGQSKENVRSSLGEPANTRDLEIAEVWEYPDANLSVVFRDDTVYSIVYKVGVADSIRSSFRDAGTALKEAGQDIKEGFKATGDTIDSVATRFKKKITQDTVIK